MIIVCFLLLCRKMPTVLEYFSYIFHFQALMCGPVLFYRDYIDFINGHTFLKHAPPSSVRKIISFGEAIFLVVRVDKWCSVGTSIKSIIFGEKSLGKKPHWSVDQCGNLKICWHLFWHVRFSWSPLSMLKGLVWIVWCLKIEIVCCLTLIMLPYQNTAFLSITLSLSVLCVYYLVLIEFIHSGIRTTNWNSVVHVFENAIKFHNFWIIQ